MIGTVLMITETSDFPLDLASNVNFDPESKIDPVLMQLSLT